MAELAKLVFEAYASDQGAARRFRISLNRRQNRCYIGVFHWTCAYVYDYDGRAILTGMFIFPAAGYAGIWVRILALLQAPLNRPSATNPARMPIEHA